MAVKATPKAMKLLEKAEDEKGEGLTKLEAVQTVATVYIPAAIVGVSTIASIIGANLLNKRQQLALTGAYSLLSKSYREYRKAAQRVFGEDADSKIMIEAAKDVPIYAGTVFNHGTLRDPDQDQSDKVLFYDVYSRRYFNATMAAVIEAQYHANRNFILRGGTPLNELYDFLGLEKIEGGDDLGWGSDMFENGYMWIDFKNELVRMDDGMECYVISSYIDPSPPFA
jgi:hypothetical protein